jgi:hypothetical protein
MRSKTLWPWTVMGIALLVSGCEDPGQDSNTQVFQTAQQAAIERRAQQHQSWQSMAQSLLAEERPGVAVKAQGDDALLVAADGLCQTINLVPCYETLAAHTDQERPLLRKYLLEQLRPFELKRLKSLGFDRVKPHLLPVLLSGPQLDALRKDCDPKTFPQPKLVFANLYWLTEVKWETFGMIPVSPAILGSDLDQNQIDDATMENLRRQYLALPEPRLAVTDFGLVGKSARLSAAASPAAILLAEFATDAKKALSAQGDLVVIAPTPTEVDVVRRQDDALVEPMVSLARTVSARASHPLCDRPMLLDDHGLSPLVYTPATRPTATAPAATKPAVKKHAYIVD